MTAYVYYLCLLYWPTNPESGLYQLFNVHRTSTAKSWPYVALDREMRHLGMDLPVFYRPTTLKCIGLTRRNECSLNALLKSSERGRKRVAGLFMTETTRCAVSSLITRRSCSFAASAETLTSARKTAESHTNTNETQKKLSTSPKRVHAKLISVYTRL
jgi:hypothetical protein